MPKKQCVHVIAESLEIAKEAFLALHPTGYTSHTNQISKFIKPTEIITQRKTS